MNKQLLFTLVLLGAVATIFSLSNDTNIFADETEFTVPAEPATKELETKYTKSTPEQAKTTPAPKEIEEIQTTLAIIKPDAVEAGFSGKIIELIELNRFEIVNMQKRTLTHKEAETFYAVHKGKNFFNELIAFMTSGPVIVMELKKLNAIRDWRYLMGKTNPERAHLGTIRAMFGADMTHNAVHGSDSKENAATEIAFFFSSASAQAPAEMKAEATEEVATEEIA